MMQRFLPVLFVLFAINARGQVLSTSPVLSFGIHFNPAFTTPIMDGSSHYDKELHPVFLNLGVNMGANVHYKTKEMTFELAANLILKSFTVKQKPGHFANLSGFDETRNNHLNITSNSTSIELSAMVSYCLHHHDKRMVYDLHAVAGCSAELNSTTGENVFTSGNTSSIVQQSHTLPASNNQKLWVNAIAGFKIHAILKVLGLIDYGLIWHIPIETNGPYLISSEEKDYAAGTTKTYTGDYKPHLGYLDVKLCYYFLNFDNHHRRVRFRVRDND